MYDLSPIPLEYIDSLEKSQHIGLFYEEPEYARIIEFRFIRNGLAMGEQCIYATGEDSGSIVLKMLTYGIPLRYFQTGRLKVYQIHNTCGSTENIIENSKKMIGKIMDGIIAPFRIVSKIVPDVSTIEGMSAELELERAVHRKFNDFRGSLICPYDVSKIESSQRKKWLEALRATHHSIIYAPRFGKGGVFAFIP